MRSHSAGYPHLVFEIASSCNFHMLSSPRRVRNVKCPLVSYSLHSAGYSPRVQITSVLSDIPSACASPHFTHSTKSYKFCLVEKINNTQLLFTVSNPSHLHFP
jgi:hypothetical protein